MLTVLIRRGGSALRRTIVLAAAACGDSSSGPDASIVGLGTEITSVNVGVGAATDLVVYAEKRDGSRTSDVSGLTWTSDNTAIATVVNGRVTGVALGGPVAITASRNGYSATTQVRVVPASIDVLPAIESIAAGESVQLTATARDANGIVLEGGPATWTVAPAGAGTLATITPSGLLTIGTPGVVLVSASIAGGRGERQLGARSAFDGAWTGRTTTGATIELSVRFGTVSQFRFPDTVRQQCTRNLLSTQSADIDATGAFSLGLPALGTLVTGTFTSPSVMTGSYVDIQTSPACPADTQGPVTGGEFDAEPSGSVAALVRAR